MEIFNFIKDISNFVFYQDKLEKSDIILIPGISWKEVPEKAAELFLQSYAPKIAVSGLYSTRRTAFPKEHVLNTNYSGTYSSESDYLRNVLIKNGVPLSDILAEDKSRNTLENAQMTKNIIDQSGINIKSAIICCQAFHARRIQITYSLIFKNVKLLIYPIITQNISIDNWYKSEYGIKLVMGEIERCGKYFIDDITNFIYE
jgi:uncharacterized SAM-binding protein YcdF (DUF218 family)